LENELGLITHHKFVSFRLIAALPRRIRSTRFRDLDVKIYGCKIVMGSVAWFHKDRGFGYIRPDDGTRFVLFHISAFQDAESLVLTEGQRLQFEIDEHDGKRAAINLRTVAE
jgi:CspA family cold shock protein